MNMMIRKHENVLCSAAATIAGAWVIGTATLVHAQTTQPAEARPFRFGEFERALTGLSQPMCAAIADDGTICVADAGAHQIVVMSRDGQRLRAFGLLGDGNGQLRSPASLALDRDGFIYVADTGNDRVQVFDSGGKFVRGWGGGATHALRGPRGISVAGDRVYVADTGNQRVKVFSTQGDLLLELGTADATEPFNKPVDVAVDGQGRMFVLDADRNAVLAFEADGTHIRSWGDYGPFSGLLNDPHDIEVLSGGSGGSQLFVTDTNNHRVQVFSPDGKSTRQWGVHDFTMHEGSGRIHYPYDLAVGGMESAGGRFAVVCEPLERRCQVFAALAPGSEEEPRQGLGAADAAHYGARLAIDGRILLIPEPEHQFVYVFDLNEEVPILITQFGQRGSKFGMFIRPSGVVVNEADRSMMVSDASTGRVQRFAIDFKPEAPIGFDPLMTRLVSAVDLAHPRFSRPVPGMIWPLTPETIRRDHEGHLHVLDRRNAMVVVFDKDMNFVRCYGGPSLLREPTDLAFSLDGGTAWVVDAGDFRVQGFDRQGRPTIAFGSFGEDAGQFLQPFGIAVDRDGFVFVSDALADRVQKFDSAGRFVSQWGSRGVGHGQFWRPTGMAFDSRDRLLVIDHGNHRAQMFAGDGTWLGTFGGGVPTLKSDME
jgi:DNA-binding beta-propeller fold protein YncE